MRDCETSQLGALSESTAHGGWKSADLIRSYVHKSGRVAVSTVVICNLLQRHYLDVLGAPADQTLELWQIEAAYWLFGWGIECCYLDRIMVFMPRSNSKGQKEQWAALPSPLKFLYLFLVSLSVPRGQLHTLLSGRWWMPKSTWHWEILPISHLSASLPRGSNDNWESWERNPRPAKWPL